MVLGMVSGTSLMTFAQESGGISHTYGDFDFSKISNPTTGSKEADGINSKRNLRHQREDPRKGNGEL